MEKIKRFLFLNVILSLIFIGIIYCLSLVQVKLEKESNMKYYKLEQKIGQSELNIVNLGSSHTYYGIKYPNNIKGYNLAMSGQPLYYDYEILRKYYKKLNNNCIIVIPISIFTFYTGNNIKKHSFNYINILNKEVLIGIDKKEYFFRKYFSATQPMTRIISIIKYLTFKSNVKKDIEYPKNLSLKEKKVEAIQTSINHLSEGKNKKDNQISKTQLKDILKFCEKKGFKPILILTPMTYLYNEQIGEKNYQERIYDNIKEIEKQIGKKYLYLDYSHDKRFINNLEYFSDDDHLNEKGAEYFTEILLNDIEAYGYNFK